MRYRGVGSKGFSVPELLITMVIFSALMIIIFSTFSIATSVFQDTDVRQSSELQLRSIKLLLERDLELTDFWSIRIKSTTPPRRDAISFAGMEDWHDENNFPAPTFRPEWSHYIVWFATTKEFGELNRYAVRTSTPPRTPFQNFQPSDVINSVSPSGLLQSRILSDRVLSFAVTPRPQNGTIDVKLILRSSGGLRPNSMEQTEDNLELSMTFLPRNSWPQI